MLLIYSVGFTSLLNCSFYAIADGTDLGADLGYCRLMLDSKQNLFQ